MRVLVACADGEFKQWANHPAVGRLLVPASVALSTETLPSTFTAADNCAFSNWDERRFRMMLVRLSGQQHIRWVAAPDVVGDWRQTVRQFGAWQQRIAAVGLPAALVTQDGLPDDVIPWEDIAALFIGGTDHWKLSNAALDQAIEAKARGKYVHVGRVNSFKRIEHFGTAVDTFDGLSYSKFRHRRLPAILEWLEDFNSATGSV